MHHAELVNPLKREAMLTLSGNLKRMAISDDSQQRVMDRKKISISCCQNHDIPNKLVQKIHLKTVTGRRNLLVVVPNDNTSLQRLKRRC